MYIGDEYNGRIRKITISTGIITTIAGVGTTSASVGDGGPATSATLYNPSGVALDSSGIIICIYLVIQKLFVSQLSKGNVYVADWTNNRIRKVTVSTGVITTITGTGATSTSLGDGGEATSSTLNGPYGISLDSPGRQSYIVGIAGHPFINPHSCR